MPEFPESPLALDKLDADLKYPGVLPPGAKFAPLDPGSYKLRLPGLR